MKEIELTQGRIAIEEGKIITINVPELSEWSCLLFGATSGNGLRWAPEKGKEPNFFWRWMQFICFGNRWVKEHKRKGGGR